MLLSSEEARLFAAVVAREPDAFDFVMLAARDGVRVQVTTGTTQKEYRLGMELEPELVAVDHLRRLK
ncbi:MAG TPA: hypothetical protein VHF45_07860 [Thermoleophilaceae bacterium]|nr:hypothetical protein [Thermoleophilaceae bacterium]